MVMRSHANNPNVRILNELADNHIFIEFVPPGIEGGLTRLQATAKRAFDVAGAAFGLLLTWWIIVIAWLLATIDTGANGFFVQQRVGYKGRFFNAAKIRTMRLTKEEGTTVTTTADPRITRLGRFWRKTKIDELPQLWNVLKGDMSLVGPRPLPIRDVQKFGSEWQKRRFSVKPGLTCLWQVSGRNNVKDFGEWVRLDLQYIDNWSLWLDLTILLRTIPVVLSGSGAK